ncbi:MAG TPA: 8-amino-7-oxononanoate synthase [Chitinophagaceae bacterium]|nr:8-amino-7-oxononanoate synthase [Chitinophagaceae bacterium]
MCSQIFVKIELMPYADDFLVPKLAERTQQHALRKLYVPDSTLIDFCSNDYLGIATNRLLQNPAHVTSGSAGSRLLAGNTSFAVRLEQQIATFHQADAALLYNSGYDANVGLLSCVPQKQDAILYDSLSHASIRDGIKLSAAASYAFVHNSISSLAERLAQVQQSGVAQVFVVTESVFSMDGDIAPLREMVALCQQYQAHLIVDEAHATGIIGLRGEGLVQTEGLTANVFARIHTFGKACCCHGAVVLGSERLYSYLINFSRSIMYTTALPEHALYAIEQSYTLFPTMLQERSHTAALVQQFQQYEHCYEILVSNTPIQAVVIPGNSAVRAAAQQLASQGFDVRPVLYPTVPKGKERLRIILHSFNTMQQVLGLCQTLNDFKLLSMK